MKWSSCCDFFDTLSFLISLSLSYEIVPNIKLTSTSTRFPLSCSLHESKIILVPLSRVSFPPLKNYIEVQFSLLLPQSFSEKTPLNNPFPNNICTKRMYFPNPMVEIITFDHIQGWPYGIAFPRYNSTDSLRTREKYTFFLLWKLINLPKDFVHFLDDLISLEVNLKIWMSYLDM